MGAKVTTKGHCRTSKGKIFVIGSQETNVSSESEISQTVENEKHPQWTTEISPAERYKNTLRGEKNNVEQPVPVKSTTNEATLTHEMHDLF